MCFSGELLRGYYTRNAANWFSTRANNVPSVLRIINFINARVFAGNLLYTPRLYITEDESPELAITTMIPYDFFESARLDTLEYITCYTPEFLGKISAPLFLTLLDRITPEMAIFNIRRAILGEDDAQVEWTGSD